MITNNLNSKPSSKLRVANVHYLNACPYQSIRRHNWVDYIERSPTECARLLLERECDLACIPIAEYFAHGGYQLLEYCIAADGPVQSVFLFSESPIENLQTILLDTSSQTSASLLKILLVTLYPKYFHKICLKRSSPEKALTEINHNTAALIIGDLAFHNKTRFKYCFDLAELWKQTTGLPFIFAVWAINTNLPKQTLDTISEIFSYGIKHRVLYARSWADENNSSREAAANYVLQNVTYNLNDLLYRGAREFLERGWQQGIFPNVSLNFPLRISSKKLFSISLDDLLDRTSQGQRISIDGIQRLASDANINDLLLAVELRRINLNLPNNSTSVGSITLSNINDIDWKTVDTFVPSGNTKGYLKPINEVLNEIDRILTNQKFQFLRLLSGSNPEQNLLYYLELLSSIKANHKINIIALSAQELQQLSKTSFIPLEAAIKGLKLAGLDQLSSAGAEILIDRKRKAFNPALCSAIEWLQIHRHSHEVGLRSIAEIRYHYGDTWEERSIHLKKLRSLQDETSGFTSFLFTLKELIPINQILRLTAISFIFLDNFPMIQFSLKDSETLPQQNILNEALELFGATSSLI